MILLELDQLVAPGSKVIILAHQDEEHRTAFIEKAQARWDRKLENISTQQVKGQLGSRYTLDQLPVQLHECSRIFILAGEETKEDEDHPDAATFTVVLQIR